MINSFLDSELSKTMIDLALLVWRPDAPAKSFISWSAGSSMHEHWQQVVGGTTSVRSQAHTHIHTHARA